MRRLALLAALGALSDASTLIGASRGASDAGVIVAGKEDAAHADFRVAWVPAKAAQPDERAVFERRIDFPRLVLNDSAAAYLPASSEGLAGPAARGALPGSGQDEHGYFDLSRGVLNDRGVAIAGVQCRSSMHEVEGRGLFWAGELTRVALERAASAEGAVLLMGALAEEHGFYGGGECLLVGDAADLYVMHIAPSEGGSSAAWQARRVPDGHVVALAGVFALDEVRSDDLHSAGLPEGVHFANTFGAGEAHAFSSSRRVWRVLDVAAPSLALSATAPATGNGSLPLWVTPDAQLTREGVFALLRDHYEDTPWALSRGLAAGPFGWPARFVGGEAEASVDGAWERPISLLHSSYSYAVELRGDMPAAVAAVLWFAPGCADCASFVPLFAGPAQVPAALSTGSRRALDRRVAWWATTLVCNWGGLQYDRIVPTTVRAAQRDAEMRARELVAGVQLAARGLDDSAADASALADLSESHVADVTEHWSDLFAEVVARHHNGYETSPDGRVTAVGYPVWWLDAVGYTAFPAPSPYVPYAPVYGDGYGEGDSSGSGSAAAAGATGIEEPGYLVLYVVCALLLLAMVLAMGRSSSSAPSGGGSSGGAGTGTGRRPSVPVVVTPLMPRRSLESDRLLPPAPQRLTRESPPEGSKRRVYV